MAWPQDPIADDKTDETATAVDHAAHHNDLAGALNSLRGHIEPMASSPWSNKPGARVGSDTGTTSAAMVSAGDFDQWEPPLATVEAGADASSDPQATVNLYAESDGAGYCSILLKVDRADAGRSVIEMGTPDGQAFFVLDADGLRITSDRIFFGPFEFDRGPIERPTITGSLSSNLADVVADLLSALHDMGIITNETTS